MIDCTDQTGRKLSIPSLPIRIVSLVPSITELLYDLGLDGRVVGITKFCVHPAGWYNSLTRIGGTKNPNISKIEELQPDLILANKEENRLEDVEVLASKYPVWVSDVRTVEQALMMISDIGRITQTANKADNIIGEIRKSLTPPSDKTRPTAIYLIWWNPVMAVSSDTFIHDMMNYAGMQNLTAAFHDRYPILKQEEIELLRPDVILLSSEPYSFKEEHVRVLSQRFPDASILKVDGEMFSWYGSRMTKAGPYFKELTAQIKHVMG